MSIEINPNPIILLYVICPIIWNILIHCESYVKHSNEYNFTKRIKL